MAITDGFKATDPEYAGIVEAFLAEAAGDETQSLPARTRYLAIVAALLAARASMRSAPWCPRRFVPA